MAKAELEILANVDKAVKDVKKFGSVAGKSLDSVEKETKQLSKSFTKFASSAKGSLDNVSKGFDLIKVAAAGALAFVAGKALVGAITDVAEAASIQEDAINSLNTALKLSGDFSEAASIDMQKFASDLQGVSTVGDETTLEMLSLAKAFGVGNEGAKELVEAAVELSAATGIELESAVKNLGKTFSGLTGELGESLPALRNLTAEQLKAGGAIGLVLDRFGGAALSKIKTFSGATTQLGNTFGDLKEQVGFSITQNPLLIQGLNVLNKVFADLIKVVADNQDTLSKIVEVISKGLLSSIPLLIRSVSFAIRIFKGLIDISVGVTDGIGTIVASFSNFSGVETIMKSLIVVFNSFKVGVLGIVQAFLLVADLIPGADKAFSNFGGSIEDAKKSVEGMIIASAKLVTNPNEGLGAMAEAAADIAIKAREIGEAADDVFPDMIKDIDGVADAAEKAIDGITGIADGVANTGDIAIDVKAKIVDVEGDKAFAALQKELQDFLTAKAIEFEATPLFTGPLRPVQEAAKELGKSAEIAAKELGKSAEIATQSFADKVGATFDKIVAKVGPSFKIGADIISGVLSTVGTVFDTAASVFSTVFSVSPFEKLLAGIENFVSAPGKFEAIFARADEIVSTLLKSLPAAFKAVISAIPKFIDNIILAFESIVDIFIDQAPEFIEKLAKGATKIVTALVKALPQLIRALPAIVKKLADEIPVILDALLKGLPDIIKAIAEALPQLVKIVADLLPELVETLADNIGPIAVALVEGINTAIPQIATALIQSLIVEGGIFRIAVALVRGIISGLAGIVEGLVRGLANALPEVFNGLGKSFSSGIKFDAPDWLIQLRDILSGKTITDKLRELFEAPKFVKKLEEIFGSFDIGSPGGKEGLIPNNVPILGALATGGTIPSGFNNDTFTAGLSSGEMVVPRDDVDRLSDFLDQQSRGQATGTGEAAPQQVTVNLQIGEDQLANVILNLNRQGFRLS